MVLDISGGLFGDRSQFEGIPKEKRVQITRDNPTIAIIVPGSITKYWTCPGAAFLPDTHTREYYRLAPSAHLQNNVINGDYLCAVQLPHGAVITAVTVWGENATDTWYLYEGEIDTTGGGVTMATANLNTEDTSITNPTIDNINHGYMLYVDNVAASDEIYGARITYTIAPPDVLGAVVLSTTAYSGAGQKLKGFTGTYTINNHTGVQQTYNFTIANTTKGTTLETRTGLVIANTEHRSLTYVWSTSEVSHGDVITFTITSGEVGTAGASNLLGYVAFSIDSIEETDKAT